jgi:hypothetical protein
MRLIPAFAAVLIVALGAQLVDACSCAPITPKEGFDGSTCVFQGKVVKITLKDETNTVEFEATKGWKGDVKKAMTVTTNKSSAMCGYGFEKDKTYIVFAAEDKATQTLQTNLCTRTTLVDDAKEDLDFLGAGKEVK